MKKRYLKKWVEVVLVIILMASLIILGAESYDIKWFLASKIISVICITGSSYLLFKYGRFKTE